MSEPRQMIMRALGKSGCYFLSLVHLAEEICGKRIDAVEVYQKAFSNGWTDDEVTMIYPASVLSFMTGMKFNVAKKPASYTVRQSEYEVLVFQNETCTHFVLGDGSGRVKHDPMGNSNTVRNGRLVGKRIFSVM